MKTRVEIHVTVLLFVAGLLGGVSTPQCHAVTIDWVTIGNPGNANDPATGGLYGAVGYEYRIGRYEVTIAQYAEFLNNAAKSDPYGLYNTSMATDLNIAGIARSGSSGSYSYSLMAPAGVTPAGAGSSGNRPITYVSWFDAARFANWMHNGQGSGSTETGVYTLVGGQTSGNAAAKNPGAMFYVPTENEWYKAAFYSPVKGGVGSPGYYTYATQRDVAPGNTIGGLANQANYYAADLSVTQSNIPSSSQNYLTDVGAFTNSASYYGTFDQSGNVYEWTDLMGAVGAYRGARGGSWYPDGLTATSSSSDRGGAGSFSPSSENSRLGFRLAGPATSSAVPEIDPASPGSVLALVTGTLGLLERRRKTRC